MPYRNGPKVANISAATENRVLALRYPRAGNRVLQQNKLKAHLLPQSIKKRPHQMAGPSITKSAKAALVTPGRNILDFLITVQQRLGVHEHMNLRRFRCQLDLVAA